MALPAGRHRDGRAITADDEAGITDGAFIEGLHSSTLKLNVTRFCH